MRRLTLALCGLLAAASAAAHGVADNHLQILVVGDRVKMNMTVDMRVLKQADADGDGYASLDELREHGDRLRRWIRKTFDISDAKGNRGVTVFNDITSDLNIADGLGGRVDHARILQTLKFEAAPDELRFNLAGLTALIPELRVSLVDASSGLRYRLGDPARTQTVPMPEPAGS